jgi:hypothetical protein
MIRIPTAASTASNASMVPDEEPEEDSPADMVHDQVAGLLGSPGAVWVPGHPEDLHSPGATTMTNST